MQGLVSSLGIEWKELIAQIINFALLVFVLAKFVYKPIIKAIDDKEKSINDVENKSAEMEKKLQEIEDSREGVLKKARLESQKIIKDTEVSASILKKSLIEEAKRQAETIVANGEQKIKEEDKKLREEIRREVGTLVSDSIEKSVGKYIDEKARYSLKDEATKEFAKANF